MTSNTTEHARLGEIPTPLEESLGLLERAVGYARLALQEVTPPMLGLPTPCSAWDLATLLAHMAESLDALTEAADLGGVADPHPPGAPSPVDAVELLRLRACSLLGSWASAARDDAAMHADRARSSSVLASAGAIEIAVHAWDVSQSTGARVPVPAGLARDLVPWLDVVVSDADRPARFGYRVGGPTVGPSSRLLTILGREP